LILKEHADVYIAYSKCSSDLFEVLLGAKNFLSEPWEINFNTVSSTTRIEAGKKTQENKLTLSGI
jgi:hypothetical protein